MVYDTKSYFVGLCRMGSVTCFQYCIQNYIEAYIEGDIIEHKKKNQKRRDWLKHVSFFNLDVNY